LQWAEMLEKEFAGALAINSEQEAAKKATSENLLKATSTVHPHARSNPLMPTVAEWVQL